MPPGVLWVSASRIAAGAELVTHRSVASAEPCASTAASTPSAIRRPSRLTSRSTANATGTMSTATLAVRPAKDASTLGAWFAPLEMSVSRPVVVACAKPATASTTAMPSSPNRNRIRSAGRCTRAASSGSSTDTGCRVAPESPASPAPDGPPEPSASPPPRPRPSCPAGRRGPPGPAGPAPPPLSRSSPRLSSRLPTTEELEALDLPDDVPVIRTVRTIYTDSSRPVEASVLVKGAHLYELEYREVVSAE